MKYEVWFRTHYDGRAPEAVNLPAEYTKYGVLEASDRRELERKLLNTVDTSTRFTGATRRIRIGDVVVELPSRVAYIYTPTGAWASTKMIKD